MSLVNTIRETRIQFNENAREKMGNWATRDVQLFAEAVVGSGAYFAGIGAGLGAAMSLNTSDEITKVGFAAMGAILGIGGFHVANFIHREIYVDSIANNLDQYLRLVGKHNATEHGPYQIRSLIKNRISAT